MKLSIEYSKYLIQSKLKEINQKISLENKQNEIEDDFQYEEDQDYKVNLPQEEDNEVICVCRTGS